MSVIPAKFCGLVSSGGTGKIISGRFAGSVGEVIGAPLDGRMIVVVA